MTTRPFMVFDLETRYSAEDCRHCGQDAIALANGLPGKTGTGADAPRLWAAGKIATVCNYVAFDVELTRRLFEQVLEGKPIRRHDGSSLLLPRPEGVTG